MINDKNSKFNRIFLFTWRPFFWLATAIFLIYSATLSSGLVYLDDHILVAGQYQFNQNLLNIPQAFQEDIFQTGPQGGSFYRPLLRLTFMWDAQFGQENIVFMSHLSNLLLHILAICLLFKFLLKLNLKKETAFLVSLICGIHPLTAQTVALIGGRNDSLLAIFIFLAFIFFLDFLRTAKNRYFIGHLIFFTLALFTKETAVILPVVYVAYLLIFFGWKKVIENYEVNIKLGASWIGIVVVWFLIRWLVLYNLIGNAKYNILFSIYNNFPSLIFSLGKIFLPFNLSVFPIMQDMSPIYGLITIFLLFIWLSLSVAKNPKLIIFGFSWFIFFLLPTLVKSLDKVPEFSENRIYLPMFGFIFVILGLGRIKFPVAWKEKINYEINKKKIIGTVVFLIILIYSSVTIYRNRYYQDQISFWRNAVTTSPSFAFNHNNLGAMYYLAGNLKEAEQEYKIALALNKNEAMVHNNLGVIYMDQKKYTEADTEFKSELEINPGYDKALDNLQTLYYRQKPLR